jgi:hypothetical protein
MVTLVFASPTAVAAQTAAVAAFSGNAVATVYWVGGSGDFAMSSSAPLGCTVTGALVGAPYVGPCVFSAYGTFTNSVCGTGTLTGTASIGWSPTTSMTFDFFVIFIDDYGIVVPQRLGGSNAVAPLGVIEWLPAELYPQDPSQPGAGVCATGFTLSAVTSLVGP